MTTANIIEFLKIQSVYDNKVSELSIELNEIAIQYPSKMGGVSDEGRKLETYQTIIKEYNYNFNLLRKFN